MQPTSATVVNMATAEVNSFDFMISVKNGFQTASGESSPQLYVTKSAAQTSGS